MKRITPELVDRAAQALCEDRGLLWEYESPWPDIAAPIQKARREHARHQARVVLAALADALNIEVGT